MSITVTPQFKWNIVFHAMQFRNKLCLKHTMPLFSHNIFILQVINYQLRYHNSVN